MFITKSTSKGSTTYYLAKTFKHAKTGKHSTKIVERIGSKEEVISKIQKEKSIIKTFSKEKISDAELKEWLKNYAKKRTKEQDNKINFSIDPNQKLSQNGLNLYNGGYLIIQIACHKLGIDKICKKIKTEEKTNLDLENIFMCEIYNKLLCKDSDIRTQDFSLRLIEKFKFTAGQINKGLKILAKHALYIQECLYLNSCEVMDRDLSIVFNNCMNYFYYVGSWNNNGHNTNDNKTENYITQTELLFDANGFPVVFVNNSDVKSSDETCNKINDLSLFMSENTNFISFSDSYPSINLSKIIESSTKNQKFLRVIPKTLSPKIQKWILDNNNWSSTKLGLKYNLAKIEDSYSKRSCSRIKKNSIKNTPFYKTCKIQDENGNIKYLLVLFTFFIRQWHRVQRNERLQNIGLMMDKSIESAFYKNDVDSQEVMDKYRKFIVKKDTEAGTLYRSNLYDFRDNLISDEEIFDGYICFETNQPIENIDKIMNYRNNKWLKEELFKNMQHEFFSPKVTLSKPNAINAHLLISFTSLMIASVLKSDLKDKYFAYDVMDSLNDMKYVEIKGIGWMPVFRPNKIIEDLNRVYKTNLDVNLITDNKMLEIIKEIKTSKKYWGLHKSH